MKEEHLKKMIKKSALETSEDFLDELMITIKKNQEAKKVYPWRSLKTVVICCTTLMVILTFFLFKLLGSAIGFLNPMVTHHKIPVFVIVALIFLYFLNTIIILHKDLLHSQKKTAF